MKKLIMIALLATCLSTVLKGETDENPSEFVSPLMAAQNAYNSKDIRSIRLICNNLSSQNYLIDIISSAPESRWKEEVMIELLMSPWHLDRTAGKPTPPGTPPVRLYQLAVDYLAPYIPEEGLKHSDDDTYRKLSSFEERKKLAERFREARMKSLDQEKLKNNSNNGQLSAVDATIPPGKDITLFPDDDNRTDSAPSKSNKDNKRNILVGVVSVIICIALLMVLKKKS